MYIYAHIYDRYCVCIAEADRGLLHTTVMYLGIRIVPVCTSSALSHLKQAPGAPQLVSAWMTQWTDLQGICWTSRQCHNKGIDKGPGPRTGQLTGCHRESWAGPQAEPEIPPWQLLKFLGQLLDTICDFRCANQHPGGEMRVVPTTEKRIAQTVHR